MSASAAIYEVAYFKGIAYNTDILPSVYRQSQTSAGLNGELVPTHWRKTYRPLRELVIRD